MLPASCRSLLQQLTCYLLPVSLLANCCQQVAVKHVAATNLPIAAGKVAVKYVAGTYWPIAAGKVAKTVVFTGKNVYSFKSL